MDSQPEVLSSCGVEASGWDFAGSFFVERTALEWWGDDDEGIDLRSPLYEGAIVFLRLLHQGRESVPIAYLVARIEWPHKDGKARVHLLPLRRRETHKEELARWIELTRTA
jgi:hypothetical protein